jgi:hypothetical protein
MFITFTNSQVTPEQEKQVSGFLATFLPKMQQQGGALATYHYYRPDHGDNSTIVIWPSREVALAYRQSELIKEVQAFEQAMGTSLTREGYPLSYPEA